MRVVGACANCKKRKERCDKGIPCRSCLNHFKGNLIRHPCRGHNLSNLSKAFLSERLGWHPTARALESFLPHDFAVSNNITYIIPINLGFGPDLHIPVHALHVKGQGTLCHEHIVYSWPPKDTDSTTQVHTHAVLPAIISPEGMSKITTTLDNHLSLIVDQHFRSFPLYCSPLKLLRNIYIFYRTLNNLVHKEILQKALKLLVLVHIGGDLTLPPPSSDDALSHLVRTTLPSGVGLIQSGSIPTPCFIRSQFGSVLPEMAHTLMHSVLSSLELILLNHEPEEWPVALAILLVTLMTIESIHYHDAKLPYHHLYDSKSPPDHQAQARARELDDQNVDTLLNFYFTCYHESHTRLSCELNDKSSTGGDKFVECVREALMKLNGSRYLQKKAAEKRNQESMEYFFDRLVARLLVLKV